MCFLIVGSAIEISFIHLSRAVLGCGPYLIEGNLLFEKNV